MRWCGVVLALVAACGHQPPLTARDLEARARPLALNSSEAGSTEGWSWRDGWGGDVYRFVAPAAASYRFSVSGADTSPQSSEGEKHHYPTVEIFARDDRGRQQTFGQTSDVLSLPLNPGVYYLNVDGNRVERGRYRLAVENDDRPGAAIRAEDPDVVEPLCTRATVLGASPALGMFQSKSGGARASCGGTGGGAVYVLDVPRPSRVRLEAAAQFRTALELRPACFGKVPPPVACVTSAGYEAALTADVAPGRYFVVLDSAEVGSLNTGLPDAAVRGAYMLRAQVEESAR